MEKEGKENKIVDDGDGMGEKERGQSFSGLGEVSSFSV